MWILMQQNSCRHPIQEAFLMLSWKRSFLFCSSWAMQSFSHVIVESSSGETWSKKCPMPWSPVTFRFQSSFSVTVSHDNPNAYSNNTLSWISRFIFTNMNINALWLKDHYTIYTYCLAEDTNISVPVVTDDNFPSLHLGHGWWCLGHRCIVEINPNLLPQ